MYADLKEKHRAVSGRQIISLFDDQRAAEFSVQADGLLFDYSKTNIDHETREMLLALLDKVDFPEKRTAMFAGEKMNITENRAVLHTALRRGSGPLIVEGCDVMEHVLATQTLIQKKSKNMKVEITGKLMPGVTAKDITLAVIGETGTAGGTGHVIEYCGEAISDLSMEGRMTVCNMAIEGGARAGLIAPDETTYAYVKGRPHAPKGAQWEAALNWWKTLYTDEDAVFDKVVTLKGEDIQPVVTWGTSPEDVLPITGVVPHPESFKGGKVDAAKRALEYMGLTAGQKLTDIQIDTVFIGSCTNGRIEDLRAAAAILKGKKIKDGMRAMIVPGSGLVRAQAEEEGLADIFKEAGFEWRLAGCSMCLAMNPDQLSEGERCAATSNRNFEGRQGYKGRTHLVSPAMAAAAAITGHLTDIRDMI